MVTYKSDFLVNNCGLVHCHLDDGHAHVTPNAERDEEPQTAEHGNTAAGAVQQEEKQTLYT